VRTAGALADRVAVPDGPPAHACARLGLPKNFLYRSQQEQARILSRMDANAATSAI
jgi:hypothetical protein